MINKDILKDKKLLYVEDEPITRMMFSRLISEFLQEFVAVENGALGFEKFKSGAYDLIITDLAMPEMDGFEMIRKIREQNKDIPIVVTTAYQDEADKISDSVDIIVNKPVNKDKILELISEKLS